MHAHSVPNCGSAGRHTIPPEPYVPYVGPRPFTRSERDRFFGRGAETQELLSLVIANPVVLLYAPSGAGKSSLLEAGVRPLLESEYEFELFPSARVRPISSPARPDLSESNFFSRVVLSYWMSADPGTTDPSASVTDVLRRRPHATGRDGFERPRALVIDQFEEIFTAHPEHWEERGPFFEQLAEALSDDPLLRIVISIREDHLALLDSYVTSLPGLFRARFRLELLEPSAAEQAITHPLRKTGRRFDEGVAERLIADLRRLYVDPGDGNRIAIEGQYVEPVHLQVACAALWQELPADVTRIGSEHLREFADVDKILGDFYDRALLEASRESRIGEARLRRLVVRTFITPMGTRGLAYYSSGRVGAIPVAAIEVLERHHVIRGEWRAGARWFEITHDRLIEPIIEANRRAVVATATHLDEADRPVPAVVTSLSGLARLAGRAHEKPAEVAFASGATESDEREIANESITALCLSGGGYRSMLFNGGALARLNHLGWLPRFSSVVAVSSGAITAGTLGLAWPRLSFDAAGVAANFDEAVLAPLGRMASWSIDVGIAITRLLTGSQNKRLASAFERLLFGEADLQDLPDSPEVVLLAAHLQSGQLWRFSKRLTGSPSAAQLPASHLRLANAVAAASAIPPFLSPATVEVGGGETMQQARTEVDLTDGTIYDSLATETIWRRAGTVLVSDGKGSMPLVYGQRRGWFRHVGDVLSASDIELRELRRRQALTVFTSGIKAGCYWSISTPIEEFGVEEHLPCPSAETALLAAIPTRFVRLDRRTQERLINWGYAVTDAAIRAHLDPSAPAADMFPFPGSGVG
jgi:predicted acylesterase/phospholipase RssA